MKIPLPVLSLVLLSLAGCAETPERFVDPALPMDVLVGNEFKITLEANHSTGYRWQVSPYDRDLVSLEGVEYKRDAESLAGAGGAEVWTFRGKAPGELRLTFRYVRTWEKQVPPDARARTFTVNVRDGG